jgi:Mrp family chromosome partitioning ATPase
MASTNRGARLRRGQAGTEAGDEHGVALTPSNGSTKPTARRGDRSAVEGEDRGLELRASDGTVIHNAPKSVTDALRFMLAKQGLKEGAELPRTVGVLAALRGEGVSFIARSLALVLATDYDRRVCLIETNWAFPAAGTPTSPGVAEVVHGEVALDAAVQRTSHPGLDLLPAGIAAPAERPIVARSAALVDLLATLAERYDHVIVDLAAARVSSEGLTIAALCDGIAMVVRQGTTPESQISEVLAELTDKRVIGVILNAYATRTPRSILRRIPTW